MTGLLQSNLVQLLLTSLLGISLYLALRVLFSVATRTSCSGNSRPGRSVPDRDALDLATKTIVRVCVGILTVSLLLQVGEVYSYSDFYKRSFFYFGDGAPFLLLLPILFFLLRRQWLDLTICWIGVFIFGQRATIVVAFLVSFLLLHFARRPFSESAAAFRAVVIAFFFWLLLGWLSNFTPKSVSNYFDTVGLPGVVAGQVAGQGVCNTAEACYSTQVQSAVRQRLLTAVAGLWMTLKGGFAGSRYPGTSEAFGDFMVEHNPFGINDTFNVSRMDWVNYGGVQHSYLNFGSGYGSLSLLGLLTVVLGLGLIGWFVMRQSERHRHDPLILYYLLTVTVWQFQPWIQSGSFLLILVSACAAHIVYSFLTVPRR